MTKHTQPQGLPEGIYFDLPNDAYHNDPALSRSNLVKLLVSEYDFWENSNLNPNRKPLETDATRFGKLAELYLFEEKKFMKTYNVAGGGWSPDKRTISRTDFDNVRESARLIQKDPKNAGYYTDGYPQVSIFYRHHTGVMLRVRPDWLRPFGCTDLKRLKSLETTKLGWFIVDHGYDIQEMMCIEAVLYAKDRLRAGKFKVMGKHDPKWLKRFIDDPDSEFRFICQRSVKPYIYRIEFMEKYIRLSAQKKVDRAVSIYTQAVDKYGLKEWPAGDSTPHEFKQVNLPMRSFQED